MAAAQDAGDAGNGEARRVLLVVEDEQLAELLAETLDGAGHETALVNEDGDLEAQLAGRHFDVVIVDVDTRARTGAQLVTRLRRWTPSSTIVALLPCGGLATAQTGTIAYHFAIEKPARLSAVLSAVRASRRG
jgi:DNA-binding NtrC family response regulator